MQNGSHRSPWRGLLLTAGVAIVAAGLFTGNASHYSAAHPSTDAPRSQAAGLRLADGHSDACKWNYDNCMKGCDGATQCSNQCRVNYDKCMQQGQ